MKFINIAFHSDSIPTPAVSNKWPHLVHPLTFCIVNRIRAGQPGFQFPAGAGKGYFLFATASRPAPMFIQPPIKWIPGGSFLGVKRPGREADHSPPCSAGVKECVGLYIYSPNTPSWRGAQLKKHRDNFTACPIVLSWNPVERILLNVVNRTCK